MLQAVLTGLPSTSAVSDLSGWSVRLRLSSWLPAGVRVLDRPTRIPGPGLLSLDQGMREVNTARTFRGSVRLSACCVTVQPAFALPYIR